MGGGGNSVFIFKAGFIRARNLFPFDWVSLFLMRAEKTFPFCTLGGPFFAEWMGRSGKNFSRGIACLENCTKSRQKEFCGPVQDWGLSCISVAASWGHC